MQKKLPPLGKRRRIWVIFRMFCQTKPADPPSHYYLKWEQFRLGSSSEGRPAGFPFIP